MKRIFLVTCLCLVASSVRAQTVATPNNKLAWTEVGQAAATAGAAVYNSYLDAATVVVPVSGVICVAAVPATDASCTSSLPVLTLGQHTLTLSQVISGAESAKSASITFTFVVVIQPTSVRIAKLLSFWKGGVLASRGRASAGRVQVRPLRR